MPGPDTVTDLDPHSQVEAAIREHRPIEAQYVRQGKRNYRLVWVLAIGLALAAIATFGAWVLRAGDLARTEAANGKEAVDAETFSTAPAPAASATGQERTAQASPPPVTVQGQSR